MLNGFRFSYFATFFAIGVSQPAIASTYSVGTATITNPSGQAEAIFEAKETPALIASTCMDLGWGIKESTATTVVCETRADSFLSFLKTVGNSRSELKGFVAFSIAKIGDTYRVQGRSYGEEITGFGQVRQVSGGIEADQLQEVLLSAGGKRLPNSTVTGVDLGVRGKIVPNGYKAWWVIDSVEPGSIGARVGLQVGDKVEKIGTKSFFKDIDPLAVQRFAASMKKGAPATLTVLRGDQALVIEVPELYRPK